MIIYIKFHKKVHSVVPISMRTDRRMDNGLDEANPLFAHKMPWVTQSSTTHRYMETTLQPVPQYRQRSPLFHHIFTSQMN